MTENGDIAKTIGAAIAPTLKAAGFRKRANSFNRLVADGMVHRVAVELGAFDPSGIHHVPGLNPDRYGEFTVSLGIYIPARSRLIPAPSAWVTAWHTRARWNLSELAPGLDEWSDIRDRVAVEAAKEAIEKFALPHLDSLADYVSIIKAYERHGPAAFGRIENESVALDMADLHLARGDEGRARAILEDYLRYLTTSNNHGHKEHVREFLRDRGFNDLAEREF